MKEIPTKDNVELMREVFPQKDESAPDPEAERRYSTRSTTRMLYGERGCSGTDSR
jgi:hypothetical protein